MLELNPSPVRVSSEAAHKLPRFMLLTVLIVFALSGLFGRDLWSSDEAQMLGEVSTMMRSDIIGIFMPGMGSEVIVEHGPLTVWIASLFALVTQGFLSTLMGIRLSALVWFAVTTASIWYGTWFLARRKEAQPLSLVFGKGAAYRDYGRLVADSATLFVVSLFGLVVVLHEPTLSTAQLALASLAYFGCAWSLTRPYWASALSGVACGLLMLASNLMIGITALISCLLAHIFVHGIGRLNRKLITTLLCALLTLSLWPLSAYLVAGDAASDYFNQWAKVQAQLPGLLSQQSAKEFVQHFMWYLCPVWPLAAVALWRWRKSLSVTHIALPLAFIVPWLLGLLLSNDVDLQSIFSVIIAPTCTLAAFGLMSSKRNAKSMLECFSVAIFTLAVLGLWTYWAAFTFQWPEKMHYSVVRLVADESASGSHSFGVVIALLVTIFWIALCVKRLSRHPIVFWNGPWLSASGMTTLWITALMLFGPAIDSNRTYKNIAQDMHAVLLAHDFDPATDCVRTYSLSAAERAAISWHSKDNLTKDSSGVCRFYISRQSKGEVHPSLTMDKGVELKSFRPHSNIRYRVGTTH